MYSGRLAGRSLFVHEWFKKMIPTLKRGWLMGVPIEGGIGIFEFKGIKKPKKALIKIKGIDERKYLTQPK